MRTKKDLLEKQVANPEIIVNQYIEPIRVDLDRFSHEALMIQTSKQFVEKTCPAIANINNQHKLWFDVVCFLTVRILIRWVHQCFHSGLQNNLLVPYHLQLNVIEKLSQLHTIIQRVTMLKSIDAHRGGRGGGRINIVTPPPRQISKHL